MLDFDFAVVDLYSIHFLYSLFCIVAVFISNESKPTRFLCVGVKYDSYILQLSVLGKLFSDLVLTAFHSYPSNVQVVSWVSIWMVFWRVAQPTRLTLIARRVVAMSIVGVTIPVSAVVMTPIFRVAITVAVPFSRTAPITIVSRRT
jgi:hypothetical protein